MSGKSPRLFWYWLTRMTHPLSITHSSAIHPSHTHHHFSGTPSTLSIALRALLEESINKKITIFRRILQNFAFADYFSYIRFYRYLFSLFSSGWFVITPPASTKLKGGYTGYGMLVSPCPSVDRIVSALYLQQYSSDEILANSLNL